MYKVLLVDDEILVREAIGKRIAWKALGFELAGSCDNGKTAIEFLEHSPVDLVLTDICMPYIDGMGLSRFVCENYPRTSVVIFSGYSDFEYAKQAIRYKVAEYILKPVTAKELTETLLRVKGRLDMERQEERKLNKLTEVYSRYTKNEWLIISGALSCLVKGTQEIDKSIKELEGFGINIKEGAYCVAAADVDVYSNTSGGELKKESALMSFVVENVSSEILKEHNMGLAYRDSDSRVYLLLYAGRTKRFYDERASICEEIKKTVYDAIKLSISIGIGKYAKSLEELPESYRSAVEVLKCRYSKGTGVVFVAEDRDDSIDTKKLEEYFTKTVSALIGRDEKEMWAAIDGIEEYLESKFIAKDMAVGYFRQIMQMTEAAVLEIGAAFGLGEADILKVTDAENLRKAMKNLREYIKAALAAVTDAALPAARRQAAMALDYIERNYGDPDLSLNQICDYLKISTSRFCTVFKEATGKTFIEALTNVRIDKAKLLLKQTSLRNHEIAERVGFGDSHYFSITFKKMTGKTPKEYARAK